MSKQYGNGSFERVALPAQGQCPTCHGWGTVEGYGGCNAEAPCPTCKGLAGVAAVGAPDSRSETLSPREWPTLGAARKYLKSVRHDYDSDLTALDYVTLCRAEQVLEKLARERRRRPRGESGDFSDAAKNL